MKKTILGTLIVILTLLNQVSFAQAPSAETQRDQQEKRSVAFAKIHVDRFTENKKNSYTLGFKFGMQSWIGKVIQIRTAQVPAEKVLELDKNMKPKESQDTGSRRTITNGYFRILGVSKEKGKMKLVVEYTASSPAIFQQALSSMFVSTPTPTAERTDEPTEVFIVYAGDLGSDFDRN